MTDFVNTHFARHTGRVRPRIVCRDGWSLSAQASDGHYCYPRESGADRYSMVEVGCVERADGSEYRPRQFGRWSGTVCGWVPVSTVNRWIRHHGGQV